MNKVLIVFFFLLSSAGQLWGQQSFRFLDLPSSAKSAALGGAIVSGLPDAGLWVQNPALLDSTLSGQLLIDYQWFYADVRQNSLAFVQDIGGAGTFGLGMQYLDYGQMQGYDPAGEPSSWFSASDYVVQLSHARKWRVYQFGGSLKWASSGIAAYRANALLLDVGGTFRHPEQELVAGFSIRNMGLLVRNYTGSQQAELPLDVRLGLSFKPQFMPFRFTFTASQLQRPDLGSADPAAPFNKEAPPLVDNIMRHFSAGTELLLSNNLNLRAGYNHLRRQELKLGSGGGLSGFSFGLMLRVRSFRLDYTRAWYHAAGGTSQLSLVTDFNKIFKNRI